jgi:type VII secretion-associated serine protease mycosin
MRWPKRATFGALMALFMVMATATQGMAATYARPLPSQWWFTAWAIEDEVWPITRGSGATVAVLDSGVEASIPDLSGAVLPGGDAAGGGGDGRTDTDDAEIPGHGTGVASMIASQGTGTGFLGVAPEAKILPVVVNSQFSLAPGIRYAVDHGAKVINISQGSPAPCPPDLQQAVAYALGKDVVVIASAGNDGDITNSSEFPANCAGVLAVGAADSRTNPWVKTQRQPYVAVAAPGVRVAAIAKDGRVHTIPGGTSQAAALTSGAAALVRSKYPQASAREVVQRLIASTRDAGPKGKDDLTGYGVVRPSHALAASVPKDTPNPVFDAYDKWVAANGGAKGSATSGGGGEAENGTNIFLLIGLPVGALLGVGAILLFYSLRSKRRPRPAGPGMSPYPGAPQSFGGPYPPQGQPPAPGVPPQGGPAPGVPPQYQPPTGQGRQGTPPPPQGQYPPSAQPGQWGTDQRQ